MRDYAQVRHDGRITADVADKALAMLEIDENGLDEMDKRILEAVIVKFGGGPVGVGSLAVAVGEEPDTIEEVYEPYLIMEGYLNRTSQGRVATELSYKKLNLKKKRGIKKIFFFFNPNPKPTQEEEVLDRGGAAPFSPPCLFPFCFGCRNALTFIPSLIIGAGPIIIGQACEFDYSGTQACKALKEEGYRVVLVNSNPATIMTDPEFADRTYIEPITPECVEKIIVRETEELKKLGAKGKLVLLPTLGGQTALNTAMALFRRGAGKIRRRNDRRESRSHPERRRPPDLQRPDVEHRPRRAHLRHGAQHGRSPRRRRQRSAVSRSSSGRRSRSAARAAASATTAKNLRRSPSAASSFRPCTKSSSKNPSSAGRNTRWK